jgi:hypothetical protein
MQVQAGKKRTQMDEKYFGLELLDWTYGRIIPNPGHQRDGSTRVIYSR